MEHCELFILFKVRTFWETHTIWKKNSLMVLTNQLIYSVHVKAREFFSNFVAFPQCLNFKLSIGYSENRANRTITLLLFCKGSISAQLLSANSNGAISFLKSILILLHFKRDCAQTSRKSWKNVLVSTSKYSRLISQKILRTSKIVGLNQFNPDHHATKYYSSACQVLFCYFLHFVLWQIWIGKKIWMAKSVRASVW